MGRRRLPPAVSHAERHGRLESARDALIVAAAALTQPRTEETIAFALMHAGIAVLHIATADPDSRSLGRVIATLEAIKAQREEGGRGNVRG